MTADGSKTSSSPVATAPKPPRGSDPESPLLALMRKKWLATLIGGAVCLIGAMIANRVWSIGFVSNDAGYFAYVHQLASDGYLPYRDYFVIHGPVTYWIAGIFERVFGDGVGRQVFGGIVILLLMSSAAWLAVFAVGKDTESDSDEARDPPRWLRFAAAGAVAAAVAGSWGRIIGFMPVGGRPKFLATALVMIAVGTLARRRPLLTGVLLGLACWTWQVAVFQATGLLLVWTIVSITRGRTQIGWVLLRVFAGGLLVSAVVSLIMLWQGVWPAFVEQVIEFPLKYQIDPWEARNPGQPKPTGFLRLVWIAQVGWTLLPKIVTAAAIVGLLSCLIVVFRERGRSRPEFALDFRWGIFAIFISSYVQILFVAHGPGYAAPLLAPAGAMAGWVIGSFVAGRPWTKWAVFVVATAVAIAVIVIAARPRRGDEPLRMVDFQRSAAPIIDLADGGEILVVGDPILRAVVDGPPREFDIQWVLGRTNQIAAEYPGGLEGFAAHLLSTRPPVVYLSERIGEFEPVMLASMGDAYVEHPTVRWNGRPVYVLEERP
ncbi:MAG: glycosyltransferase family 87 protein [Phycisphaerales bacterium]